MRPSDYFRLLLLAAIWGSSFIFMRALAPVLGPLLTADLRVLIAGVLFLVYFRVAGVDVAWRKNCRHYAIIGAVNSAVPFCLFSFAALHIPAAYSAIINSTSPLFGAVFGALWLGESLTVNKLAGLVFGVSGVALVASKGGAPIGPMFAWAVAACLGAAVCYGLAGVYIKKFATGLKALPTAGGSHLLAGVLLLPFAAAHPPHIVISAPLIGNLLGLAVLCSAVAYSLYYRLIADVGPTRALTVTFLVPGFGMVWGALFLAEPITATMLGGCAMIVIGTILVTRKSASRPIGRSA